MADPQGLGHDRLPCTGFPFPHELCRLSVVLCDEVDDFSRAVEGAFSSQPERLLSRHSSTIPGRRAGFCGSPFAWPEETRRSLRHTVLWVTQLLVPLAFIVGMAAAEGNAVYSNSLGRLASHRRIAGNCGLFCETASGRQVRSALFFGRVICSIGYSG